MIPMTNKYDRVVLLVDMDCFYCQVEEKLDPNLRNQPIAVVQYNAWRGGGIIAVNYAARAKGVTRHMRGDEAKKQCAEIKLVKVPNVREKADLTKYREAGKEVASVLQRFSPLLERASVDEAYIDITLAVDKRLKEMNDGTFILQPQQLVNTYAVGFETIGEFVTTVTTSYISSPLEDDRFFLEYNENDIPAVRQSNIRLLIGASIANEIRCAVKTETLYECSAGIAHNKILAKLACGINKPNKQTILPLGEIPSLFKTLPIGKIKGLGAKFGEEICERLNVQYLGQLLNFTESELQRQFDDKNGSWLYNICRGIDLEAVTPRFYSKSIGCCKKFPGRNNITGLKTLQHWLNELANEINERLEKDICENNRRAKQMVVNFTQDIDAEEVSSSRSAPLQSYDKEVMAKTSLEIIKINTKQFFRSGSESILNNPIKFLGISVGKFETISNSQNKIQKMFAQQVTKKQKFTVNLENVTQNSPLHIGNCEEIAGLKDVNESHMTSSHQVPVKIKSPNMKSFFLNPLKEERIRNKKADSTDKINMVPEDSVYKLDFNESNQMNSKFLTSCAIVVTGHDNCNNNTNKIASSNSFFARALRKKEETPTKEADLISESNASSYNDVNNSVNSVLHKQKVNRSEMQNSHQYVLSDCEPVSVVDSCDFSLVNTAQANTIRKHDTYSDTDEPELFTSYRHQYAEFATPELRPELLQFYTCSKCNAKILNDSISKQTHEDLHYAQDLSKQQRHEFRDIIREKINVSKSRNNSVIKKSQKTQHRNNSSRKTLNADIIKFLKPSLSGCDEDQSSKSSKSYVELCNICKLPIKVEEFQEHKDFHTAKELQRQLNQLEVYTVEVGKNTAPNSLKKCAKSPMNMRPTRNQVPTKRITEFFTKNS